MYILPAGQGSDRAIYLRIKTGVCETCGQRMDGHTKCDLCGILTGAMHESIGIEKDGHTMCSGEYGCAETYFDKQPLENPICGGKKIDGRRGCGLRMREVPSRGHRLRYICSCGNTKKV